MSLHRVNAKRDATEKAIVQMLRMHGCVVWEVSGTGLPDLIVMKGGRKWLADAKGPKGKPTPAQEKKWEEAATKAQCAVFILRTPEDAVALLKGGLMPWEPETLTPLPNGGHLRSPPRSGAKAGRKDYVEFVPPRSPPMDAAKEAEATFAPSTAPKEGSEAWDRGEPYPLCGVAGCGAEAVRDGVCRRHQ